MRAACPSRFRASLVIPTKNGGELFRRVVEGLCDQSCWHEIEFIVIDSGSTDDTTAIALSAGAIVHTIPPEAFNHGATRDYGISLTSCENVILMVQDAVPNDAELLTSLLSALDEKRVAGVYARQIPRSSADVMTKRSLNSWLTGRLEREVRYVPEPGWYEMLSPMEKYFFCNFDNVCSAIRKEAWRQECFGRVDFGEDIDWAERVLKRGYTIIYEPAAGVIHSHDRSLSYEYRRTYLCHRKLYRQFQLHLVPTPRALARAWAYSLLTDMPYVARSEKPVLKMLGVLLKVPILNFVSVLAQYQSVRDEIRGVKQIVRGV